MVKLCGLYRWNPMCVQGIAVWMEHIGMLLMVVSVLCAISDFCSHIQFGFWIFFPDILFPIFVSDIYQGCHLAAATWKIDGFECAESIATCFLKRWVPNLY